MNKTFFLCFLFSVFWAMTAFGDDSSTSSRVVAQAEIDDDSSNFLPGTARLLRENDILLVVQPYKHVKTDKETILYGRVVQSLRGAIPVEALIKWSNEFSKLPAGNPSQTNVGLDCMMYVLSSSKTARKLPEDQKDFLPLSDAYDNGCCLGSYDLGSNSHYFPHLGGGPSEALRKLLYIEPARITEESEVARFREKGGK